MNFPVYTELFSIHYELLSIYNYRYELFNIYCKTKVSLVKVYGPTCRSFQGLIHLFIWCFLYSGPHRPTTWTSRCRTALPQRRHICAVWRRTTAPWAWVRPPAAHGVAPKRATRCIQFCTAPKPQVQRHRVERIRSCPLRQKTAFRSFTATLCSDLEETVLVWTNSHRRGSLKEINNSHYCWFSWSNNIWKYTTVIGNILRIMC